MRESVIFPCIVILAFLSCQDKKEDVAYGSNNGRHVLIDKKVYYEEYGDGMPLLLLSGGGLNRSIKDFAKCIPGLSEYFRVIAPDTPGQGRSRQADTLTYDILTNTMSKLIDSLHLDSVYIMGWSDGGIVGILLAEKRPDVVKKVISVGPNNGKGGFNIPPGIPLDSVRPPTIEHFEKMNKSMVEDYSKLQNGDWKNLVEDLNNMWYAEEYFSESIYDRIQIPVMIVLGDRDEISLEHGLELHHFIKGSQFCVLPNTTHDVFKEQPELINKVAINFFNSEPSDNRVP